MSSATAAARENTRWWPSHVPALDGLRGLAIALVLLFHCQDQATRLHLAGLVRWGWTGVNLFFVLSGFLITGIILDSRADPHFFRNFYARRALRIWPLYFLLLPLNYWIFGPSNMWNRPTALPLSPRGVPWLYFILMVQNLKPGLVGTIFPTWSLAIEEQFYLVWAPVARRLRPAALAVLLLAVLASGPWCRAYLGGHFTATNTLYKLDGLAVGGLLALGMRCLPLTAPAWRRIAWLALAMGAAGWVYALTHGGPWFDTLLAIGFGGMVLSAVVATRLSTIVGRVFRWTPLRQLGVVSYCLYLVHMPVYAYLGGVAARWQDRGIAGPLAVIALRLAVATLIATASWHGLEKPLLRLKRRFRAAA